MRVSRIASVTPRELCIQCAAQDRLFLLRKQKVCENRKYGVEACSIGHPKRVRSAYRPARVVVSRRSALR